MPISGLTPKQNSQSWRKNSSGKKQPSRLTIYTGGNRKKQPKDSRHYRPKNTGKKIAIALMVLFGIGVIFAIGLVAWATRDLPDPNKIIDRSVAQSSKIFDESGDNLLYEIHGNEKRTLIELSDIPEYAIQATLTAEDRNFYEHSGISVTGIIRSVFINLTTGSRVGGSTLTQQLVKQAILSSEKTYTRKIKEAILAYQIERKFTKDEILKLYFNEIPYGSVTYGIEAAAETYFGKSAKEITLAEAAILAALPQRPTTYSPYGSNTDLLYGRQHWILDSMVELNYITEAEATAAKNEEITFKERTGDINAPHFVLMVREYLAETYGELAIEQDGLHVVTTLDTELQKIAEETVTEYAENNAEQWQAYNAALVAIDTATGHIRAMVGSKDFFGDAFPEGCTPGANCKFDPQVNTTTRLRQPGSSFKPIVYTAALKKGFTTETVLQDVETVFKNYDATDYTPHNYDLQEHGPVTMRKALAGSLNIPAVKAIYLAGIDNVLDLAEDLGYTSLTDRSRFGLSLVLGGGEVKLTEHVAAFAALAQEGSLHPANFILEVRDKNGNVLEEYKQQDKKVLETQTARQITDMLSDNSARQYIFGAQNKLNLGNRPVAAKTGTTNDYRDAWTIGYTAQLAAGVWVGNSDNSTMKRGAAGGVVAAPIWHSFMQRAHEGKEVVQFIKPEPIKTDKPSLTGAIADGVEVKIDTFTGKLATEFTPEHLIEEKKFQDVHSILHYINKDDPQGDAKPDHNDEQYQRWEEAVLKWAEEQELTLEEPPTEFDDVHTQENQPTISITQPANNQTINNREFSARINASAPRGIERVEYYLNGQLLQEVSEAPYELNTIIGDIGVSKGFYPFKAIAYDDADNSRSYEIELNLQLEQLSSEFNWKTPQNGTTLHPEAFPLTLSADLTNTSNIKQIDVFYRTNNGPQQLIATVRQFPGSQLITRWSVPPQPGEHRLSAEITTNSGLKYRGPEITLSLPQPTTPEETEE